MSLLDRTPKNWGMSEWNITRMCFEVKVPRYIATDRRLSAEGKLVGGILDTLQGAGYVDLTNEYLSELSGLDVSTIISGLISLNRAGIIEQEEIVTYRSLKVTYE